MKISSVYAALLILLLPLLFFPGVIRAENLTPEQIESLKKQIKELKENLHQHLSSIHESAGNVFLQASGSNRGAIELYLRCQKLVNYERKGLKESDFRAWKESQAGRLQSDQFAESLRIQLRYLALSCRAAEVKKISEVFAPLTSYVSSLTQMKESPDQILMNSVANSVFAKAYDLESLLGKNAKWESVPYHIGGIYGKTILPYLREEKPEALMAAWDRRIEQETQLVSFYEKQKNKELRGKNADEKRKKRNAQKKAGGKTMAGHNKDTFIRETLPNLKWGKLKDMFKYIDQLKGAQAMLAFVKENLETPNGEKFFQDFLSVIESAAEQKTAPPAKVPAGPQSQN